MAHWLVTAINTYILHPLHGNGYQWWSGFGGRSFGTGVLLAAWWHHHNCATPGCWRMVKAGHSLCRRHELRA